jgi:hypothetical protein
MIFRSRSSIEYSSISSTEVDIDSQTNLYLYLLEIKTSTFLVKAHFNGPAPAFKGKELIDSQEAEEVRGENFRADFPDVIIQDR